MRQIIRKGHMWLGLILAVFILLEAVTGFIMAEPWVIGAERPETHVDGGSRPYIGQSGSTEQNSTVPPSGESRLAQKPDPAQGGFSAMGFVKMLHQGNIGGLDLGLVLDFMAVGLIILTITGIYLSIPILRSSGNRRE